MYLRYGEILQHMQLYDIVFRGDDHLVVLIHNAFFILAIRYHGKTVLGKEACSFILRLNPYVQSIIGVAKLPGFIAVGMQSLARAILHWRSRLRTGTAAKHNT